MDAGIAEAKAVAELLAANAHSAKQHAVIAKLEAELAREKMGTAQAKLKAAMIRAKDRAEEAENADEDEMVRDALYSTPSYSFRRAGKLKDSGPITCSTILKCRHGGTYIHLYAS